MADETQPKEKTLEKIKSSQQALKAQIKQLEEGISAPKAYSFQTEEIREMVQGLVTQNKRLSDKVDYLLSILMEASSDLSDDVFNKTLAAMAKSQVDMVDQLAEIKEKALSGEVKTAELEKLGQETDQKLKTISDAISQLSYAKQLEDLKSNVSMLSADIQRLEKAVSSETPAIRGNIDSLKAELDELKEKVSGIDSFRGDIKGVENQLAGLEETLSKKEKQVSAELSSADKETLQELSQKIFALDSELKKMEKAIESYPASEAQEITGVKEKLGEIEAALNALKESPHQENLSSELESIRAKINSMEKMFREKQLDMERKREAEMQVITDLLKKIEADLETAGGQQATQLSQILSDLSEKTKVMADMFQKMGSSDAPRYFNDLKGEIVSLSSRLARIENYVKQEKVADYSHISDVQTEIRAIRRELESMRGMEIKPQVISKVRENIRDIEVPTVKVITPQEREKILSIKANIDRSQREIKPNSPPEMKELGQGLQQARDKVGNILNTINETEQGIIEQRETVKRLRGDVLGAPVRSEDTASSYLFKLPMDTPVKLRDAAALLSMDYNELMRILLKIQKEQPDFISVRNTGYGSKLLGQEPSVIRLK